MSSFEKPLPKHEQEIIDFIMHHVGKWKDHTRSNYYSKWDKFERAWLQHYSATDRERLSERSRLISPDTAQAIETYEDEMNEAIFGGDKWFDIEDDANDQDKVDIEKVRTQLTEDLEEDKVPQEIKKAINRAGVFGKGIAEIIISDTTVMRPVSKQVGGMTMGGIDTDERFSVKVHVINPKNFFIEPSAETIEDAMGVAIEEMVPAHQVIKKQQKSKDGQPGAYRDVKIGSMEPDYNSISDQDMDTYRGEQVRLLKYYGLVPREWLKKVKDAGDTESALDKALGVDDDNHEFQVYSDMVEAIVVIANDCTLLKCEANNYMMKDRPVIAFDCDSLPGKFWGRGKAEKGENMQAAIDGKLRMHMDSEALTAAPMMGLDASRLPRGFKFEIYPGRAIKVNGPPAEIFNPFKFGESTPMLMETMNVLQQKFLQSVGSLDSVGMAQVGGNAGQNSGLSLAMGGIIKKNRRNIMNFTDTFLIPLIRKVAWRYMQFDPDRYPVKDYKFKPISTLGMIAREYEQQHIAAVMSTLGPESPLVPILLIKYVEYSGLPNKQELIQEIKEAGKPNPEAEAQANKMKDLEMRVMMAELAKKQAESAVDFAKAADLKETTRLREMDMHAKMMGSMSRNSETDPEFQKRVQVAELALKEMDQDNDRQESITNAQIVDKQMSQKDRELDIKEKAANRPAQSGN